MNPDGDGYREPCMVDHSAPRSAPRTQQPYRNFRDRGTGQILSVTSPSLAAVYAANTADFEEVRAVALDAVVIDGPLPEVEIDDRHISAGGAHILNENLDGETALSRSEKYLRGHAAIVGHLREHPPVDEAQVRVFSKALIEAEFDHVDGPVSDVVARRMVAKGYRIEATS